MTRVFKLPLSSSSFNIVELYMCLFIAEPTAVDNIEFAPECGASFRYLQVKFSWKVNISRTLTVAKMKTEI